MDRKTAFWKLKDHPMLYKSFSKLAPKEISFCEDILEGNKALNKNDFGLMLNRLFLDGKNEYKHKRNIQELLSCANSTLS